MIIILNPSPFDDNLKVCDLTKVSLFLVNEIEGYQITGEKEPEKILEAVKEKYPSAKIVLTLGGEGSAYQDETGIYRQGIFKVKAVDTTAAGDTLPDILFLLSLMECRYRRDLNWQPKHLPLQFPVREPLRPSL